jgi:prolyl-tRNA synthetase
MDLIGLPYQLIVGPKGIKSGEVEMKARRSGARQALPPEAALARLVDDIGAQRIPA